MLEWYRVGYRLSELMNDCDALIGSIFADHRPLQEAQRFSYCSVFKEYTGLDPAEFDLQAYSAYATVNVFSEAINICGETHSPWLDFLFSHKIQPHLGHDVLCMVYGYPACQSLLARLNENDPSITERVELFLDGIELGTGFFELADANEQDRRFNNELMIRNRDNLPLGSVDRAPVPAAGTPSAQ